MNVYETAAIASPSMGVLAGIGATRGSTLWCVISAVSVGLTVGVLLHAGVMVLVKIIYKTMRTEAEKDLTNFQLALGPLALFLPISAPFATMFVTSALVKIILV